MNYSKKGLRTLLLGKRELSENEYLEWSVRYKKIFESV